MSFTMSFFRKKSEPNAIQAKKFVSHGLAPCDPQQTQANGNLTFKELDNDPAHKKLSTSKSKASCIFIESSEATEPSACVTDEDSTEEKIPMAPKSSQLSKNLEQVLHDKDALPYFIQYMDSVGAANLVKFWLDADTFQAMSRLRINSRLSTQNCKLPEKPNSADASAAASIADMPPVDKSQNCPVSQLSSLSGHTVLKSRLNLGSVTAHGHGEFQQNSPLCSPTSVPKNACESASLVATQEREVAKNCQERAQFSLSEIQNDIKSCNIVDSRESDAAVLPSCDSLQKASPGISSSVLTHVQTASEFVDISNCSGSDPSKTPNKIQSENYIESELDSQLNLNKSIENDAVVIFTKYLSPDCSQPISISEELRSKTVERIFHEDGSVDPYCFVNCQQYVFGLMDNKYYPEFLHSVCYIKHQIDILSQLQLVDILYNDTSLLYFTEFMEEEHAVCLLQCFLDLDNFQHHLFSQGYSYDGVEAQNDAMIIYDKYISMQATHTIRFDDKVRLTVESNICRDGGPLPDCFMLPRQLVLQRMQKVYFPLFVKSEVYTKYVTDLLNTSHLMQDSIGYRRKRAGSDASSEKSAGSHSIGSESITSKNTYLARDTSGQHFAKAMNKFSDNMRIDSSLLNPDNLWHRPNARMKFGKVTELGQFVSDFDPDPDHDKKKTAFFTAAKRREKEKSEEDMAWKVAQQIIKDVMSVTTDDDFLPDVDQPDGNS